MKSFSELIEAFAVPKSASSDGASGVQVVAGIIGCAESHVRTMKARDSIPPLYWGALVEAAQERQILGVTHRFLKKLRDAKLDLSSPQLSEAS